MAVEDGIVTVVSLEEAEVSVGRRPSFVAAKRMTRPRVRRRGSQIGRKTSTRLTVGLDDFDSLPKVGN